MKDQLECTRDQTCAMRGRALLVSRMLYNLSQIVPDLDR